MEHGQDANGRACREFLQEVTIEGKTSKAYGKACKDAKGEWKLVQG